MTDLYLRGLGFAPTDETSQARRPSFSQAWRYQHQRVAQDGARLFIEHPLGIDCCRLSAVVAPLAAQDVFATLPLHDKAALETAIAAYYAAHGGVGPLAPRPQSSTYRPYRRQE